MISERELIDRTNNAFMELSRYGSYVWSLEFVELLEKLADINDDLCHGRSSKEDFDEAKELLDRIKRDL